MRPSGRLHVGFVFVGLRGGTAGERTLVALHLDCHLGDNLAPLVMWSFNGPGAGIQASASCQSLPGWAWPFWLSCLPAWTSSGYRRRVQNSSSRSVGLPVLHCFGAAALSAGPETLQSRPQPLLGSSLAVGIALTELAETLPSSGRRTALLLLIFGCLTVWNAILSDPRSASKSSAMVLWFGTPPCSTQ